jgi:hypothetical protein
VSDLVVSIVAGLAGRDRALVDEHIAELAELGCHSSVERAHLLQGVGVTPDHGAQD